MTDSIGLAVYVENGSDGLSLALTPTTGYTVPRSGIGPGPRVWNRKTVESDWVHGRTLVSKRLEAQTGLLVVRVRGFTVSEVASRWATLMAAVEQDSYQLRFVLGGVTSTWQCEAADSAPGDQGVWDETALMRAEQTWRLTIPRDPIPVTGQL